MPARAEWKGFLQVNQLQVPVKAFSAASTEPEISLNQLHRGCGQRIRQQRYCPQHGPVESEAIIPGYQVAEGYCLPLDSDELERLKPEPNKTIAVECFVDHLAIDPVFHSGRTLYLTPDGPPGQRPFNVLRDGMAKSKRHAFSRIVMSRRELLIVLRPAGRLLAMTVIEYAHRVRPATDYESEVAHLPPSERELGLVQQLIEAMTEQQFDLSKYRDGYMDRLSALIERQVAATDLTREAPRTPEAPGEQATDEAMLAQLETSLLTAGVPDRLARKMPNSTSTTVVGEESEKLPA